MPLIDVHYPKGALTEDQRGELAEGLMTVLLRAERAPDTEFFRNVTWVYVNEDAAIYAGGKEVEQPTFRIDVTTPQGALSDRRREELVGEATRVVREISGIPEEESIRIWVLCHEVDEGSWGAAGNVVRFEQLRQAAAAQREQAEAPA